MTTLALGILIGLALGAILVAVPRGRFTHRNAEPRSRPPVHGPNYNPLPEGAVKPPPPPAPPPKREALPGVRCYVPIPTCKPPRPPQGGTGTVPASKGRPDPPPNLDMTTGMKAPISGRGEEGGVGG